ncbi:MAG: glutamate synthase [Gemmatimonadetes bacterium]|nr:glutamate synthase [Gemmatimonadota bacterium]
MSRREFAEALIRSRGALVRDASAPAPRRKQEAEGGCGVVGIACEEAIPGRHLLRALEQMRNRGNGKGGGIAAVGLIPEDLGVTQELLERDYLLAIAYLDPSARDAVEREHIEPIFEVDQVDRVPTAADDGEEEDLEVPPPEVYRYFVRVRTDRVRDFRARHGLGEDRASPATVEDEIVYQNSARLNRECYATGEKRAFVLSHGKNLLVLKMVGYGDDVVRHYRLEDFRARVWIGHHRYPTKGRVWHPGGAHPFIGLHEALVHNGDFANYASVCEYLAQRNIRPLFLTDTEVSVLVFDLLHRVYGYPLEHVIEALAPTTERDFTRLPADKQRIYRMLQTVHLHGSPDGPWFFLIAQSVPAQGLNRLIGITDTSMLRPQVFALQRGPASIGLSASEKQAIDAVLESLAREDSRFWGRADRYWNARGGSHTDGGAFLFEVQPDGNGKAGRAKLLCTDKFGRPVAVPNGAGHSGRNIGSNPGHGAATVRAAAVAPSAVTAAAQDPQLEASASSFTAQEVFEHAVEHLPEWGYEGTAAFLGELVHRAVADVGRARAFDLLALLMDRRYATVPLRRSRLLCLADDALAALVETICRTPSDGYVYASAEYRRRAPHADDQTVVLDARGFAPEGRQSLALEIVRLRAAGFKRFVIAHARGHRFIANGLGRESRGVRIDVYGSPGDYLASGIDGAKVFVHGSGQDQLAQIMKAGTLVVYGDVGQTFMYGAKGGRAFVLGNAAGRPLINAVGSPRVVINGTCLDYLAESFMAGDPLAGGGFVILNGITLNDDGSLTELDTPYPGGNLFSLASGGAIYVRDPLGVVSEDQLNGGQFAELADADWAAIKPYLEENERLFGILLERLLTVDGRVLPPERVYRKIRPGRVRALEPEEAWVRMRA